MTSMMKTWRERIIEARERGGFSQEDYVLAKEFSTCMVGECERRFEVDVMGLEIEPAFYNHTYASVQFLVAVNRNLYDDAERVMEIMEDHALQLKREAK